jgi:FAD-dependent urate hydroxylase
MTERLNLEPSRAPVYGDIRGQSAAVLETPLLVIGAGPYGLSTAALAQEHGIETLVVGHPMGFWREHMPAGMSLRSGVDWHLDASGVHTLAAFVEEQGIDERELDPIPLQTFVDYSDWFLQVKRLTVHEELVTELARSNGRFEATLAGGERIAADDVVCAPGIRHYTSLPEWASAVPAGLAAHTCDLVGFDDLAGARVLIVGGRQSAYEWAALLREHGAERIDVVHRHPVPRFARVDWTFADAHVESTTRIHGYWRKMSEADRDRINRRFWEVGRLTLEHWLMPRLESDRIHRRPDTHVVAAAASSEGDGLDVVLSDATRLTVDRVVFATGYRADLTRVEYLHGLMEDIERANGFPVLDEFFGTSTAGLYITGFSATQDFGPFFGFVTGVPASSTLIVRDLISRDRAGSSSLGRPRLYQPRIGAPAPREVPRPDAPEGGSSRPGS